MSKILEEITREELISKVEDLEQQIRVLKQDLIHDSLTHLKTRAFFEGETKVFFNAVVYRNKVQRREWFGFKHISFVLLDIDFFKKINDEFGHLAGDGVLKAVANAISASVREGDIAARWGGEEIVVALVGATEKEAHKKAEDIRRTIERMSFNDLGTLSVTVSGGVAEALDGTTFEEVLEHADKALYRAKESGRNKVLRYSEISEREE